MTIFYAWNLPSGVNAVVANLEVLSVFCGVSSCLAIQKGACERQLVGLKVLLVLVLIFVFWYRFGDEICIAGIGILL